MIFFSILLFGIRFFGIFNDKKLNLTGALVRLFLLQIMISKSNCKEINLKK